MKMIPIVKPIVGIEEVEAVKEVILSGELITPSGRKIKAFENAFSEYIGAKYSVATNSGTAALHTSLAALNLKQGDEVITTPFSFVASGDCILMVNAKPVFVDINLDTYTLDPQLIEDKITENTRAIEVVHIYGLTCNMDEVNRIAREYDLKVVEDAAQAHGAKYRGKMAGNLGDVAAFSFWATKNMTTGGGGMLTTSDSQIYEFAKLFRFAGEKKEYEHVLLGYDYVMSEIQAAIGIIQLNKLDSMVRKRRENAKFLNDHLSSLDLQLPIEPNGFYHAYNQYTIRCKKRDKLKAKLASKGIQTRVYYPILIPLQKYYRHLGYKPGDFPNAEKATKECLSLPVHPGLTEDDLNKIVKAVKECMKRL
ncbi:MAG: DegT/DnrJ/EryC1/StrS family aminotransferase [Candidatus Odinarchaeia archaeon]